MVACFLILQASVECLFCARHCAKNLDLIRMPKVSSVAILREGKVCI